MNTRTSNHLLALFASMLCLSPPAASVEVLAIDGVRIIDTLAGRASGPRCIRIVGRIVEATLASGSEACSADAVWYDAAGLWALPGLIDMHAHHTLGPLVIDREDGEIRLSAHADDEIADFNGRRLVAFGVTTIRNPGGSLAAAARYEERRRLREFVGPETHNAGPVINNQPIEGLAVAANTDEEIRRIVAEQAEAGADWIKLYTGLSDELVRTAVRAADASGIPTIAHLDRLSWPNALEMGVDSLVHLMPISPDLLAPEARERYRDTARPGSFAFFEWWEHFDPDGPEADRLVAAFNEHRPVFDATLVAFHAAFWQDQGSVHQQDAIRYAHPRLLANWNDWFTFTLGWQDEDFERARAVWPKVQRLAVRLYGSDARTTIGSDMSNPWIAPGISLHREMQLLADAGVPASAILRAATVNAAEALGAANRLGRVAAGYEADIVLLSGNPLASIEHSLAIVGVVNDGRLVTGDEIPEF